MIDLKNIQTIYIGESYGELEEIDDFVEEVEELLEKYDRRNLGRGEITPELSNWMLENLGVDPYSSPEIHQPQVLENDDDAVAVYLDREERIYIFGTDELEPFSGSEYFEKIS